MITGCFITYVKIKNMKLKYIALLLFMTFVSLSVEAQQEIQTKPLMLGTVTKADFQKEPYIEWFEPEYQNYRLDTKTLYKIKDKVLKSEIKVYFGSWCSDSRREVPRFIKILDFLGFNYDNVEFVALDRQKKAPRYKKNIYNIKYVPTFIFFDGNNEIGRIIESPEETLEKDMEKIFLSD